ncbi:hypothetical protein ABK905_14160 [Acerihabitans sp. KWT182]|uniref:Right-handed parallel beta-helix repeat-containing protein n=1 Tax=Acerihabitans sp. KWT182 TaxID=3157919 RepID=A0AAU7Q4Q9_9GAMM
MNNITACIPSFDFPLTRPANVTSRNDIKIAGNSPLSKHIKDVRSEFGGVHLTASNPGNPFFVTGKILARYNIEMKNIVVINADIESEFGTITLESCLIGANVKARQKLTVINCDQASENEMISEFSDVELINSNVGHVRARYNINIDPTSTHTSANSDFGTVFDPGNDWQYSTRVSNPDLNGFVTVHDLVVIIPNYYSAINQHSRPAITSGNELARANTHSGQQLFPPAITNGDIRGNELVRANTHPGQQLSPPAITNGDIRGNELVRANTHFRQQSSQPAIMGNNPHGEQSVPRYVVNAEGMSSTASMTDPRDRLRAATQQFLARR